MSPTRALEIVAGALAPGAVLSLLFVESYYSTSAFLLGEAAFAAIGFLGVSLISAFFYYVVLPQAITALTGRYERFSPFWPPPGARERDVCQVDDGGNARCWLRS